MRRYLLSLFFVGGLIANTYDVYSVDEMQDLGYENTTDIFMDGSFIEIKRFNPIDFSSEEVNGDIEVIANNILKYIEDEKDILVKVIGHSEQRTDRDDERLAESQTYAKSIQNFFKTTVTLEEANDNSDVYASDVAMILVDAGIKEEYITTEYRESKDIGYTTASDYSISLSNRVLVSLYVLAPKDKDLDEDGVMDSVDKCLNTPLGVKVNEYGCALDLDKDGVLDYKDDCLGTPIGVDVNEQGCPLDSDGDGVFDYKDDCPKTLIGKKVDIYGCEIAEELRLNFKNKSSAIPENTYHFVTRFAHFLKAYPRYNVEITGHTDSAGRAGYNMALSLERSSSVKEALIKEGIPEKRLKAFGRGELEPIETNRTAKGRALNRRIEVKLLEN